MTRPSVRASSSALEFTAPAYHFIPAMSSPLGYIAQMKQGSTWVDVETIPVTALIPWLIKAGLLAAPTGMSFASNGGSATTARRGPIPKTSTVSRA